MSAGRRAQVVAATPGRESAWVRTAAAVYRCYAWVPDPLVEAAVPAASAHITLVVLAVLVFLPEAGLQTAYTSAPNRNGSMAWHPLFYRAGRYSARISATYRIPPAARK